MPTTTFTATKHDTLALGLWCILLLFMIGCSGQPPDKKAETQPERKSPIAVATEAYWKQWSSAYTQFRSEFDMKAKTAPPAEIKELCGEAARKLGQIDRAGVDAELLSHTDRVIAGLQEIATLPPPDSAAGSFWKADVFTRMSGISSAVGQAELIAARKYQVQG
jgi:hypothetical protein